MPATPEHAYLEKAYDEADRQVRVRYLKVSSLLVIALTVTGVGLDLTIYPDFSLRLLEIRLVCIAVTTGIFALCFWPGAERGIRPMGLAWALVAQASICAMIYVTDGPRSPYYAGLNLVILGISIFLPWTFFETIAICLATLGMYVIACFAFGMTPNARSTFFGNFSFLFFTTVICTTCNLFSSRKRFGDFQLRHELDKRNRELTELDRLKSEFFSNISHELRTPLTLIVSPLDQIFRTMDLPAEARELLATVRQNSLRLLKLINDLLEIVRLEDARAQITKEEFDLADQLPGLIDSVRHLALNKGLNIFVEKDEPGLVVDADAGRVEKIFLNVMMNAIKFTDRGGSISARWKRDRGSALVEIQDTGIGIAQKDLPVIFERFRQADSSSTRRYQGSGIGLALAHELALEHGGSIDVESKLGEGSTFSIRLPLALCARAARNGATPVPDDPVADIHRRANRILVNDAPPEVSSLTGRGEHIILVVDDEPDMRRFIAGNLAKNYRIVMAGNGLSGLDAARKFKPDLVILDLMLPGMDGLEVCSQLRADPECKDMRVVLLTARLDEAAKIGALERGADDFITKPFSTLELKTRVANLIRAATLEKEVRTQNAHLAAALKQVRETEAQLIQSEKMNALGGLAAGLLHEINNPLNYTLMALQVARESVPANSPNFQEAMNDIEEGMTRIRDIILELRTFASPAAAGSMEKFDLMRMSDIALRLVSHETSGIHIERDLGNTVRASKTQVIQVLVNLVLNAAKALQPLVGREKLIKISSHQLGERVAIRVWDSGSGISPDVLPRVFEPFFTTRPPGQGTGLGLSVCHTIVKKHQGEIIARSEFGKWTEVVFDLPAAEMEA